MSRVLPPPYDPQVVEAAWQARWVEQRTNEPDLDRPRRPFYNLMMFPYPSAEGLHVGNMFAFTGADIYGRFKRLQGFEVFEPMGFDAFGIHSENFALSVGTNPAKLIPRNIDAFRRQLTRFGGMFDWRHELSTTDPRYYKWTQWIFLQLLKAGLAFRKKAAVNWCPKDKSVIANEQVINGYCERHPDTKVEQRFLEQWFFAITKYTERLLGNLDHLDWSSSTLTLQRNWIGRSEGAELIFETPGGERIAVFTTRPDTVFGATYLVLAPEHPLVEALTTQEQRAVVREYQRAAQSQDIVSRRVGDRTKTGVFTGAYARNPATGEAIPIWTADYVLMEYGTGAIMAVPAHDRRDFEFATAFGLPIRQVVRVEGEPLPSVSEEGVLLNSGAFDGVPCREAQRQIVAWLAERGLASTRVQYRLHDWCISRQRYWGPPIPIIYCDHCGPVGVPQGVVLRGLPAVRRPGPARDGRLRHLPRLVVVLPPLPLDGVRRPAVRRAAHQDVAAGDDVHRRQRACGAAPHVLAFHHDGAQGSRAPRLRGAVPQVPRPRDDREGWGEDVEVAGQRRRPRRLHPEVGRRHLPHVPDVP